MCENNGQGLDKKTSALFTPKDFMSTYTTCYDMCTQRSPYNWSEQLYDRHGETISQARPTRARTGSRLVSELRAMAEYPSAVGSAPY